MHTGPSQGSPLSLGPQPPSPHLPHTELLSAPTSTPKPSAPHTATASSSIFLAALNTALLLPTSASQLWAPAAITTSSLLPQVSAWAQPHSCCYNHSPTAHGHQECLLPSTGALPQSKAPADPPGSPKAVSPSLVCLPLHQHARELPKSTTSRARPLQRALCQQRGGYETALPAISERLHSWAQKLKQMLLSPAL